MKQEVRTESLLLQEMIELEKKLQNYRSQECLLNKKQIRKLDSNKYKPNKSEIINYEQCTRPEKNPKIKYRMKLKTKSQKKLQMKIPIILASDSAFYLEEIDKIA